MHIFVLDGSDESVLLKEVLDVVSSKVSFESSSDRAISKLGSSTYDVIVIARGQGKSDLLDVAETIKFARALNKSDIVVVEDHPTLRTKVQHILRGRKVHVFKYSQLDGFRKLLSGV